MASSEETQGTCSTQQGSTNVQKLKVTIDLDGRALGENSAKWNSRVGHYIRVYVPISFADFRKVKTNFRDEVWRNLMKEFELSMNPIVARPLVEGHYSQRFRTNKNLVRKKYLDGKSLEECLTCPTGFDPLHWKPFVENEFKSETKEKYDKNAKNRSKNDMSHSMGRRSYAQVHYLETQKNPEVKRTRVDDWKTGHVRSDGTVLESAREKYELVEAAEERIASSGEGSNSHLDISSDALSEVFGPDHKKRVRGVGSNITKKQYNRSAAAKAIIEEVNNVSVAEVKTDMANVKTDVAGVKTDMADLKSMMQSILQHMSNLVGGKIQSSPVVPSPSVEVGSNSQRQPPSITPQNLGDRFDSVTPNSSRFFNRSVDLLSNNEVVVAKGHIVRDSDICHGRKVRSGEKKVYINEVLDPDGPIYDGPQNDETTLKSFVTGGYVIWAECRIQPSIWYDLALDHFCLHRIVYYFVDISGFFG